MQSRFLGLSHCLLGLVSLSLAASAAIASPKPPPLPPVLHGSAQTVKPDARPHAAKPHYQGYPSYWVAQGVATANDGYSQLLWGAPNSMGTWTFDPSGNFVDSGPVFGPYSGWNAVAVSVNPNSDYARILWSNDDGAMGVWTLDTYGNYYNGNNYIYGPYYGYNGGTWYAQAIATDNSALTRVLWYDSYDGEVGIWTMNTDGTVYQYGQVVSGISSDWTPIAMSVNPNSGYARILWERSDGAMGVWVMDSNDNYYSGGDAVYGPYSGWNPVAIATGGDATSRVAWAQGDGTMELWSIDSNGHWDGGYGPAYGPNDGWYPQAISMNPSSDYTRMVWNRDDGAMAFWVLDDSGVLSSYSDIYGPY